jgi:hypothetical protein
MQTIAGLWRGYVAGSNRGRVFARLTVKDGTVRARAIFYDIRFGSCIGEYRGVISAEREAKLGLFAFNGIAPLLPLDGQLTLNFSEDSTIAVGNWGSETGAAGICRLVRVDDTRLRWWTANVFVWLNWAVKRSRQSVYFLVLVGVAFAAMTKRVELSVIALILLMLPVPILYLPYISEVISALHTARIKKIGFLELDQTQVTPMTPIHQQTPDSPLEWAEFEKLNVFFALRTKVMLGILAHNNGLNISEFGAVARSLGVDPENVENTFGALTFTGCASVTNDRIVASPWGQRFVKFGMRLQEFLPPKVPS